MSHFEIEIESSVIASVEYFADDQVLEITFLSGNKYAYYGISKGMFENFLAAESKGTFYNVKIKGLIASSKMSVA